MKSKLVQKWRDVCMRFAHHRSLGRVFSRLAALGMPPYKGRYPLALLSPRGYVSPNAAVHHGNFECGRHVFIGDRVTIYQNPAEGRVCLHDDVHLYGDIVIETGLGGTVEIGRETHIQPHCHLSAFVGSLSIGERVEIAPRCAFYPYNHEFKRGIPIRSQPFISKGGIRVEDDCWLGVGAVILDGVTIGSHAVIGAGSVVREDIPANAIAAGVPARVLRMRD
jgi:carbonic anhydrase/acetyltransferase-like protein (isoleucine patch superfamily)